MLRTKPRLVVRHLVLLVGALLMTSSVASASISILVFTRTEGFTHSSISDGVDLINDLAAANGFTVEVTADNTDFTPTNLARFDVVVWLSTTGDVLDGPEEAAFEGYIQAGGGYVGIHASADCEYSWDWYGDLLGNGAWFESHPSQQTATLVLEDPSHPGAGSFALSTPLLEEWYNFQMNPRPEVHVIMTLDETSYSPGSGAMGVDHPIVWAHEFDGGRVFYTALGHRSDTYELQAFVDQIEGALLWAAGSLFVDGFESGDANAWSSSSP